MRVHAAKLEIENSWGRAGGTRCYVPGKPTLARWRAFSLIELLVVIGIIGLLAAIAMPAVRGLVGSDVANAAARQLADDLAFARLRAINERATIYVVFVSPTIVKERFQNLNEEEKRELDKLINAQYTRYALFSPRSLGDQPGRGTPRYLSEWRTLPEGMMIATNEFQKLDADTWRSPNWSSPTNLVRRPFFYADIPFPTARSERLSLPCIAYNYQGQLIHEGDEYIHFSRGAIKFPKGPGGKFILADADVTETPKTNWLRNPRVRVDWLTGRSQIEQPRL